MPSPEDESPFDDSPELAPMDAPQRRYEDALAAGEPYQAVAFEAEKYYDQLLDDICGVADDGPEMKLWARADELAKAGVWIGAEAKLREVLALPNLESHIEYRTHADLSAMLMLLHRDEEAMEHSRAAIEAVRRSNMDLDLMDAMALRGHARRMLRLGSLDEAMEAIEEATPLLNDESVLDHLRAGFLLLRAACCERQGNLDEADDLLAAARRLLAPMSDDPCYAGMMGTKIESWQVTARLCTARGDHGGAVEAGRQALVRRRLVARMEHVDTVWALVEVAESLDHLSTALATAGANDKSRATLAECHKIRRRLNLPV